MDDTQILIRAGVAALLLALIVWMMVRRRGAKGGSKTLTSTSNEPAASKTEVLPEATIPERSEAKVELEAAASPPVSHVELKSPPQEPVEPSAVPEVVEVVAIEEAAVTSRGSLPTPLVPAPLEPHEGRPTPPGGLPKLSQPTLPDVTLPESTRKSQELVETASHKPFENPFDGMEPLKVEPPPKPASAPKLKIGAPMIEAAPKPASEPTIEAAPKPASEPTIEAPKIEAAPKPASPSGPTKQASSETAELEQSDPRHKSARRFARVAVGEIKLYRESDVVEGRQAKDLWQRLSADIALCIQTYEKRVPDDVRERFDYLYDELVRQLAEGDASKLGENAPKYTSPKR